MNHSRQINSPTPLLSMGLGALLVFSAGTVFSARSAGATIDSEINRFQIRTVSQSAGATAIVMVDSATGHAWVQRLTAGREAQPWLALGNPE